MEHQGHRKRIYEKLKSGAELQEHELLEILLFNALPRKNTNPVAHALIDAFGSLKGVFEAGYDQLTEVEGVGEGLALYILCVAKCAARAYLNSSEETYKNYGDFKKLAVRRLKDKTGEMLEIYLFEKGGTLKYTYSHTDGDEHRVKVSKVKLAELIARFKPYGIVAAHNHLSGGSAPSPEDDDFTAQLQAMCSLNGVIFFDHIIYFSDDDIYSYFDVGTMDGIRKNYDFVDMFDRSHEKGR